MFAYTDQIYLTAVIIVGFTLAALVRGGRQGHPQLLLGPLLLLTYVVDPLLLGRAGVLDRFFPDMDQLAMVTLMNLLGCLCFCLGITIKDRPAEGSPARMRFLNLDVSSDAPQVGLRTRQLAYLLGGVAVACYLWGIVNVGGFEAAYSRVKGGGWTPSGYSNEAPLLAYPAIVLLSLSAQRTGIKLRDLLLALLFAMPGLIQGSLGGRRGPMFITLVVLFFAWFVAKRTLPSWRYAMVGVAVAVTAVVFTQSQRQEVYIGSEQSWSIDRLLELKRESGSELQGNNFIHSSGTILTVWHHRDFTWGRRMIIEYLVRPIPKQLWPTKYTDAERMLGLEGQSSDETKARRWRLAVGWTPLAGAASGMIASGFCEFAWGTLLYAFVMGWFLKMLWVRQVTSGGIWSILYVQSMILSIYIPTQSISAFWHRFLFMSVPTILLWKFYIMRGVRLGVVPAAAVAVNAGNGE